MSLAYLLLYLMFCTHTIAVTYIDELANDDEGNQNVIVTLNEQKRSISDDVTPPTNHDYEHKDGGADLMTQASSTKLTSVTQPSAETADIDDLMAMRDKRDTTPSFKQINDFISNHAPISPPISKELRNELTAKASSSMKSGHNNHKRDDTKSAMSNIFLGLQSSKHHKLTRSDIRKLAKKAVMLATLKKLNEVKSKSTDKKINKPNKKKKKNKTSNKKKSKKDQKQTKATKQTLSTKDKTDNMGESHMSDTKPDKKSDNVGESLTKPTVDTKSDKKSENIGESLSKPTVDTKSDKKSDSIGEMLGIPATDSSSEKISDEIETVLKESKDMQNKTSEMSEDLSGGEKKSKEGMLSDDSMASKKADSTSHQNKDQPKKEESLDDIFQPDKKSTSEKPDNQTLINSILDSSTTLTKKSELPDAKITDRMDKLKYALAKSSPSKVPDKFFPDLPAGIRMIAWQKLLQKKKKELVELETRSLVSDSKPVLINIDIDQDKVEKDAMEALNEDKETNMDADKKDLDKSSSHVHYLQKHIKDARALRKLIAKTLIGHCHTTGKRILKAFVAMDKALARAQAIATVIGHKFKIDPDKIETLVGDKEDQVVETFLRDIFTKI